MLQLKKRIDLKILFKEEIKKAKKDIPIYVVSAKHLLLLQWLNGQEQSNISEMGDGFFQYHTDRPPIKGLKNIFIWIRKKDTAKAIISLFHELGHFNCYENKCKCIANAMKNSGNDITCEFHAQKYSCEKIYQLVNNLYSKDAYDVLDTITYNMENTSCDKNWPYHQQAALKTIELPIFKKLLRLKKKYQKRIKRERQKVNKWKELFRKIIK